MKPFALTRKAKADLRAIAIYTEERWGKEQRNYYLGQFDDAFHLLAENPHAGQNCEHVTSTYRKLPRGSHIIFYRSGSDCAIEIVRILHSSMDVEASLGDG